MLWGAGAGLYNRGLRLRLSTALPTRRPALRAGWTANILCRRGVARLWQRPSGPQCSGPTTLPRGSCVGTLTLNAVARVPLRTVICIATLMYNCDCVPTMFGSYIDLQLVAVLRVVRVHGLLQARLRRLGGVAPGGSSCKPHRQLLDVVVHVLERARLLLRAPVGRLRQAQGLCLLLGSRPQRSLGLQPGRVTVDREPVELRPQLHCFARRQRAPLTWGLLWRGESLGRTWCRPRPLA
jgi:hypothetical protein